MDTKYEYDLRIGHRAQVLLTGEIADIVPDSSDIAVISKIFDNYEECESALGRLLSDLASREATVSKKNFVVVAKRNPKLEGKPAPNNEEWEDTTVIRFFVAEAALLKKSLLNFPIDAKIKIVSSLLDQTHQTLVQ